MKKLLIIDDDLDLLAMTKEIFENLDSNLIIKTMSVAEDALTLIKTEDFDLVITDFEMPNLTGVQLIERVIKEKEQKFIIYSGNKNGIKLSDSIRSNVVGVFDKLSEMDALIQKSVKILDF